MARPFVVFMWMLSLYVGEYSFQETVKHLFQVAPSNVSIFYNTPKSFSRVCVPPKSKGDFIIEWWKDGVTLTTNSGSENNTSINIKEITDEETITSYRVSNGSLISELSIDPVVASDSGEYSCIARNGSMEFGVKFFVEVTGECRKDSFKCEKDKKCIMSYLLCDGDPQCTDNYDESTDAGCPLPSPPSQLEIYSLTANMATIKWQLVSKATGYEIKVAHPGNTTEFMKSGAEDTFVTLKDLNPNTLYNLSVRTLSLAGSGNYTKPLTLKTHSLEVTMAPKNFESTEVTGSIIHMQWENIKRATSYEIVMTGPDDEVISEYTSPNEASYLFKNLKDDTEYRFKVRARSSNGNGKFSEEVVVKTLKLTPPGPPLNVQKTMYLERHGIALTWEPTNSLGNAHPNDILYQAKYCMMQPYMVLKTAYRKEQDSLEVTSKTDSTSNKSNVVTESYLIRVRQYRKIQCRTSSFTSETTLVLESLKPGFYWFGLSSFGTNNIKGNTSEGEFTIEMYTTAAPTTTPAEVVAKVNMGLIVFGICSGGLMVLLILSFFLAWTCKWGVLVDAVAEYRTISNEAKESEKNNGNGEQHFVSDERYMKV